MKRSRTLGAVCAAGVLAVPLAPTPAASAAPLLAGSSAAPGEPRVDAVGHMREVGKDLALDRHVRVARRHARTTGDRLTRSERGELRRDLDEVRSRSVRRETRELRRDLRDLRERVERKLASGAAGGGVGGPVPGNLQAIASCESGGDPSAVDPSGTYRGKYQFDTSTWASVGGSGDPAAASEAEQDKRAAMLFERAGASPWPVCGS